VVSRGRVGPRPVVARSVQGVVASRSRLRRPGRTSRAGIGSSRSRSRLCSQRRALLLVSASIWSQASSSQARATIAHQIWFWAKSCSGRLVRPVSLAERIPLRGVPPVYPRLRDRDLLRQQYAEQLRRPRHRRPARLPPRHGAAGVGGRRRPAHPSDTSQTSPIPRTGRHGLAAPTLPC
jgi:hypothetical protein